MDAKNRLIKTDTLDRTATPSEIRDDATLGLQRCRRAVAGNARKIEAVIQRQVHIVMWHVVESAR